jgi:hypothetical protein
MPTLNRLPDSIKTKIENVNVLIISWYCSSVMARVPGQQNEKCVLVLARSRDTVQGVEGRSWSGVPGMLHTVPTPWG